MQNLERRITHRRRRFQVAAAAAALFACMLAGTMWQFSRRTPPKVLLRANIPTRSAPAFTPKEGSALATSHGIVIINPEDRT